MDVNEKKTKRNYHQYNDNITLIYSKTCNLTIFLQYTVIIILYRIFYSYGMRQRQLCYHYHYD